MERENLEKEKLEKNILYTYMCGVGYRIIGWILPTRESLSTWKKTFKVIQSKMLL